MKNNLIPNKRNMKERFTKLYKDVEDKENYIIIRVNVLTEFDLVTTIFFAVRKDRTRDFFNKIDKKILSSETVDNVPKDWEAFVWEDVE